MARITLGPTGKSPNAQGTNTVHVVGYNIPLPCGLYYQRQFIGDDGHFYIDVSQMYRPGYSERAFKINFTEEEWDFKIGNTVLGIPCGVSFDTTITFTRESPRRRKWTIRISPL